MFNPKHVFVIGTLASLFLIGVILVYQLSKLGSDLWYDESGQYWLAMGQHHYSFSFQRAGIIELLRNNQDYNFDPPLYTVLLHYWILVSDSILWLRLFSLVCVVLASIFLFHSLISEVKKKTALLMTLLYYSHFFLIHYSLEIRAYALSQLVICFLLYSLSRIKRNRVISFFGGMCILLITQYTNWILIPPLALTFVGKNWGYKKIRRSAILAILLLGLAAFGYVFFYGRAHVSGSSLSYTAEYRIGSYPSDERWSIWRRNITALLLYLSSLPINISQYKLVQYVLLPIFGAALLVGLNSSRLLFVNSRAENLPSIILPGKDTVYYAFSYAEFPTLKYYLRNTPQQLYMESYHHLASSSNMSLGKMYNALGTVDSSRTVIMLENLPPELDLSIQQIVDYHAAWKQKKVQILRTNSHFSFYTLH